MAEPRTQSQHNENQLQYNSNETDRKTMTPGGVVEKSVNIGHMKMKLVKYTKAVDSAAITDTKDSNSNNQGASITKASQNQKTIKIKKTKP